MGWGGRVLGGGCPLDCPSGRGWVGCPCEEGVWWGGCPSGRGQSPVSYVECAMALCCQEPHVLDDRGDNDDEEDYLM